jgi:hypothetical protein
MTISSPFRLRTSTLLLTFLAISLTAKAQTTGGTVLRWTAPGDDGYTGTASGYQVRYQPMARGSLNTEAEWQVATSVPNLPFPSPAGRRDSVMVLGLTVGSAYYFALRAFDDAGNYSLLSNSPLIVMVAMDCCTGMVGNVNGADGDEPTISDIAMLIDHVFVSNQPIWCAAEADINQSGGQNPQQGPNGDITISDITILVDHVFISNRPLPNCY